MSILSESSDTLESILSSGIAEATRINTALTAAENLLAAGESALDATQAGFAKFQKANIVNLISSAGITNLKSINFGKISNPAGGYACYFSFHNESCK